MGRPAKRSSRIFVEPKTFGERLAFARRNAGFAERHMLMAALKEAGFTTEAGHSFTRQRLYNFEAKSHLPRSTKDLAALAKVLGVSLEWLATGIGPVYYQVALLRKAYLKRLKNVGLDDAETLKYREQLQGAKDPTGLHRIARAIEKAGNLPFGTLDNLA